MTRIRAPRPTTTWLVALMVAFLGCLPRGAVVICLGADGHVGVAAAGAEDGCPCSASHAPLPEQEGPNHAPCRDLLVETPPLAFEAPGALVEGLAPIFLTPAFHSETEPATPALRPRLPRAQRVYATSLPPPLALRALRTVVLLT